jgi:hypothetical protein
VGEHIQPMNNWRDDPFLLTETEVEGTYMDPEYFRRWWEETRGPLWFWEHSLYWDQFAEAA